MAGSGNRNPTRPRRRPRIPRRLATPAQGLVSAHARCLLESLGRLHRRWLASLLTTLVIGIALALPTGLFVLVKNLDTLSSSWHRSVQISLYLNTDLDDQAGQSLADQIGQETDVQNTQFISAAAGLAQFRKASGFGGAIDALGENPLPGVIEVTPRADLPAAAISQMVDTLARKHGVDKAELDQDWLRRLTAILALISRASWVIGVLLSAAVLFIVGNTIRLDIENRREEIEVMKLLGASDAFIRRPFLYSGFWYGFIGAVWALIVLGVCVLALHGPLSSLTQSYDGGLNTRGLGFSGGLAVIGIGILLGWVGCAITVNRRLASIEPR